MENLASTSLEEEAARSHSRNTYAEVLRPELRQRCEAMLAEWVKQAQASEAVQHSQNNPADPEFGRKLFIRSTIETVLRIEIMRKINPLACFKVSVEDPLVCKQWGVYAADESLHGRLFAKDLHAIGLRDDQIFPTQPLFSTELLAGWLYRTLEEDGGLSVIASAYYVETVSAWTEPLWLDRMEKVVGRDCLKGSRAHRALDAREDHIELAWNMCMRLVRTPADEERFIGYLKRMHGLMVAYIVEVGQAARNLDGTLLAPTVAVTVPGPASA
jgi:hypothetical protein